jgi:hypothetical protein
MSAQTTVHRQAGILHNGWLGAALIVAAAFIAGIALAVALLGSAARPATPAKGQTPPAFNAPAFRAEEHHLTVTAPIKAGSAAPQWAPSLVPALGGNGINAQQQIRSSLPLSFGGNALRADQKGGSTVPAVKSDFSDHNR